MENTELITNAGQVIAVLPLFITDFTGIVKKRLPSGSSITPLIPYAVAMIWMTILYFVFNSETLGIYLITGAMIALGTTRAYDKGKEASKKDLSTNPRLDV